MLLNIKAKANIAMPAINTVTTAKLMAFSR
jgi:hypothetical protein